MDDERALSKTLAYVEGLRDQLTAWRRYLYMMPELSGEEEETAGFIADRLRRLGLDVRRQVGGHGVVGTLAGAEAGINVGYRADMDALPIQDAVEKPYRSLPLGIKHACGHDVHMALAIGVAEALIKTKVDLPGTLKLIFQPAEESLDGARKMIGDGVLRGPRIDALLAIHAFPMPTGTVGLNSDLCLAGMDEFKVRFYAPAGNLSLLIERAKHALESLSTARTPATSSEFGEVLKKMIVGGELQQTVFLTCWSLGDGQSQRAHLLGLVSIADFEWRTRVHEQIRETLDEITAAMGASYDLDYTFSNPPLHNNPALVEAILPQLKATLGSECVVPLKAPYPFAHEDLALYTQHVPTVMLWLGTANIERDIPSLLHTSAYDIDEDALVIGAKAALTAIWALWSEGVPATADQQS